jgi:hypothetical protein
MMPSKPSAVIARGTSASGMWTVASTTRSGSDQNIIATPGTPQRCASRSVWPFHSIPAAANAALLIGAVVIASTRPSRASAVARTIVS